MKKTDNILNTFTGYTYQVDNNTSNPYYELACEMEESLVDIDDFIETVQTFNPYLCKLLDKSSVTDVLIMRAW